ncbi:MAG TPA: hypothetical protein VHO29_01235 [Marmoricola sp.]|nr:hypothetical protein [Marmoricola sp.]
MVTDTDSFDLAAATARLTGETGDRQLVSLTREELYGVGDDPVLGHAADVVWWDALTDREQGLVLETAQRGLVARNLLVPDGEGELVAADEVRVVLAARKAPSRIVVLTDPAVRSSDGVGLQVAVLGLPVPEGAPYAFVVSVRIEGVYLHRLVTAEHAPEVAAEWLLRAPADEPGEAGRTVEVLDPGSVDTVAARHRAVVVGRDGAWALSEVVDGTPGEPDPVDGAALRTWLAARMG